MSSRLTERIQAVRRFNRFYTRRIGVLEERYLRSSFSLAEVRVLFEVSGLPKINENGPLIRSSFALPIELRYQHKADVERQRATGLSLRQ